VLLARERRHAGARPLVPASFPKLLQLGWTLLGIGLLTTIPIAAKVVAMRNREERLLL
jgi:hypothetical protein